MRPAYMVQRLAKRKFDCNKCVGDVNEDVARECIDIKKIVESAKEQDDKQPGSGNTDKTPQYSNPRTTVESY